MFEEGPRCCESRNLLLVTSTVTTLGTGDSYLIMGVRWLKASPRTAGGVLPQCCQINGADTATDVFMLCSWTRVSAHNRYLVWLQEKWQKMEMSKFNPCIWQAAISGCVSNTEQIEDLSKHSSFSLLLAYSLPLRHTNEKNNRDVDCLQLDWVVNEIANARMLA